MARDTIVDRFLSNADNDGGRPAIWHKVGSSWKHLTWAQYAERARLFGGALLSLGFEPGDAVAVMSYNNPEWLIADVGTMMVRGVATGIYQTCTQEQALYIANHCASKVLVLENEEIWNRLADARDQFEYTAKFVLIADAEKIDHDDVISFAAFLELGRDHLDAVAEAVAAIDENELATLIYTSGTTGPPKGVMLSHKNLAFTSKMALEAVGGDLGPDDCSVSYLPLSHIAEQMFSLHNPISGCFPIWIAEDLTKLKDALVVARPTVFLAVPRVWEKFQAALTSKLADAEGPRAKVVSWARGVGLQYGHRMVEKGELGGFAGVQYRLANKLFFSKLREGLGLDRMKVAVSGAAPISKDTLEFFMSVGIIIHEVYGQSEGTGPTTFNQPVPGKRKLGTVGPVFPGVEVRLADDGEILVKGDNVCMGYYNNPSATAETIKDGWLYSGDVGEFDADGFLRITDRKKDLIITAGGKNVAPQNIEKLLKSIDGISQAVVIGDRRKFLSALLTLDEERARVVAEEQGWPTDLTELAASDSFLAYVQKGVDKVNSELARYETVKKFTLIPTDFTLEGGELTPTQKVKRKVVNEKYAEAIEAFYADLE